MYNVNFVWLDMSFPNVKKESNTLNASVFTKFGSLHGAPFVSKLFFWVDPQLFGFVV